MKKHIIAIVFLCAANLVFSASYLEYYGSFDRTYSGKGIALSGANIFDISPEAVFQMPGAFSLEKSINIQVCAGIERFAESRAFPAYSFFDNLIGYQSYVDNINFFGSYPFVVSLGLDAGEFGVGFAVSSLPYADFNYKYYEEIRNIDNPEPNKYAINTYEISSALNSFNISLGANFRKFAFLGYSAAMLSGEYDYVKEISLTPYGEGLSPSPDPTFYEDMSITMKGMAHCLNAGINFKRFGVSFSYNTVGDLADSLTTISNGETESTTMKGDEFSLKYPSSLSLNAVYRPRAGLFSTIYVSYIRTYWSKFENTADPDYTGLYDTDDFNLAVEHIFDTGAVMRFGVFYKEYAAVEDLAEVGMTLGTGFRIGERINIDMGIRYAPLTYEAYDLFPDGAYSAFLSGAEDRLSPDRVQQVKLKAVFSIGVKL